MGDGSVVVVINVCVRDGKIQTKRVERGTSGSYRRHVRCSRTTVQYLPDVVHTLNIKPNANAMKFKVRTTNSMVRRW